MGLAGLAVAAGRHVIVLGDRRGAVLDPVRNRGGTFERPRRFSDGAILR
jgi:hypothetical protein